MVMKSVICYFFSHIREKKSFTLITAQSPEASAKQTPVAIPFFRGPSKSSHTVLSMRWMKVLFFYLIPLVSTWILTKPILETDHQFSKLHQQSAVQCQALLMRILGELCPHYKVCFILSSPGNPFSPPKMDMLYIIVSKNE